ncbi:transcriptional regulator, AraC family [Leptolyngbya sp. NIES-3755]|nr:transcriptional regulator, AraC family [Leptolyngbya sp. NIES-3755]
MIQDGKLERVHFSQDDSFLKTVPDPTVVLLNRGATLGSVGVRHLRFLPNDTPAHYSLDHAVMIHLREEQTLKRQIGTQFEQTAIQTGDIFIVPAHAKHFVSHSYETEELIITLAPDLFAQSAYEFAERDRLELLPTFTQADPLIYGIGQSLKLALDAPKPGDQLYIDSLVSALSVHLLRNYCDRAQKLPSYKEGLPRYKLNQVLEYVQTHLAQDIPLTDLAATIGMSQYYFLRSFKQSLGITPHRYVQQQRLERAKGLLKQREMTIADIALDCGFANQTHFTKSFRQTTGMTPKAYREQ